MEYYEFFSNSPSRVEQDISGIILMIMEEIISNKKLIKKNHILFIDEILPFLIEKLTESSDEIRFIILKCVTDVFSQIAASEIEYESRNRLVSFVNKKVLPIIEKMIQEKNPTGLGAIKFLRIILDFNPDIVEKIFQLDMYRKIMSYFEINNEK